MRAVKRYIDRVFTLIRIKFQERGHTQRGFQETLAWGRSYISQILTRQKTLHVDHLLLVLGVIGVTPTESFGQISSSPTPYRGGPIRPAVPAAVGVPAEVHKELQEIAAPVRGLVSLLCEKGLVDGEELFGAGEPGTVNVF